MKIQKLNDPALPKRTISESNQKSFIHEGKELYLTKAKPKSGGRTQCYYCPLGEFYSVSHRSVIPISIYFEYQRKFKCKSNVHSIYPFLRHFIGVPLCHLVALETMVGKRPEPIIVDGKTIVFQGDHINGNLFDCSIRNLRWVRADINQRDGGFLRKLRNNGINPTDFPQEALLRFFDKMALYKALYGSYAYLTKLDKPKLMRLLIGQRGTVVDPQERIDREMNRHCEY